MYYWNDPFPREFSSVWEECFLYVSLTLIIFAIAPGQKIIFEKFELEWAEKVSKSQVIANNLQNKRLRSRTCRILDMKYVTRIQYMVCIFGGKSTFSSANPKLVVVISRNYRFLDSFSVATFCVFLVASQKLVQVSENLPFTHPSLFFKIARLTSWSSRLGQALLSTTFFYPRSVSCAYFRV